MVLLDIYRSFGVKVVMDILVGKLLKIWIFKIVLFSGKNEKFTTYYMYLFGHNFLLRVVTITYEQASIINSVEKLFIS